jgi:hypothetical protein
MQRFISGSSLPCGNPVASGHPDCTIGRSGKEAEKPLGKIFGKMPFAGFSWQCFAMASLAKFVSLQLKAAAEIAG